MLLQSDSANNDGNAFRSFVGRAAVQEAEVTNSNSDDPAGSNGGVSVNAGLISVMFGFIAWIMG